MVFEVIFHNQKLLDILGLDSEEELNVMVNAELRVKETLHALRRRARKGPKWYDL